MESRVDTLILRFALLFCFLAPILSGCAEEDDDTGGRLVFMGDSIAAQWDTDGAFPSMAPLNLGIPGAGVESLRDFAGTRTGERVVMIIGTNDLSSVTESNFSWYADRYVENILMTGARRILLVSILPRKINPADGKDYNQLIERLNSAIRGRVGSCGHVTYIDAYPCFLHDGAPLEHLYNDHVHLTPDGYEILASLLRSRL